MNPAMKVRRNLNVNIGKIRSKVMKCPVCGNDTFDDPDFAGGANNHSLNDYRKFYFRLKTENPDFSCKNESDRKLIVDLDNNF